MYVGGGREVWGETGKDPLREATCEAYFWKLLFRRSYYRRMGHSQDSGGFHSGNAPCPSKRSSETPPGKRRAFPPKAGGLSPVPCLSYTVTVQAKMEPQGLLETHAHPQLQGPLFTGPLREKLQVPTCALVQGSQSRVHGGLQGPVKPQTHVNTLTLMYAHTLIVRRSGTFRWTISGRGTQTRQDSGGLLSHTSTS